METDESLRAKRESFTQESVAVPWKQEFGLNAFPGPLFCPGIFAL